MEDDGLESDTGLQHQRFVLLSPTNINKDHCALSQEKGYLDVCAPLDDSSAKGMLLQPPTYSKEVTS